MHCLFYPISFLVFRVSICSISSLVSFLIFMYHLLTFKIPQNLAQNFEFISQIFSCKPYYFFFHILFSFLHMYNNETIECVELTEKVKKCRVHHFVRMHNFSVIQKTVNMSISSQSIL